MASAVYHACSRRKHRTRGHPFYESAPETRGVRLMNYIQDWISALQALGLAPKQRGQNPNKWQSRCPHPSHPDNNPSFHFDAKPDGKVVGVCQSKNCYKDEYKALFEHMGLAQSGGAPPPIRPRAKPPADSGPQDETEPPEPGPLPSGGAWHKPFIYTDAVGKPVLAVVRKDLGINEKTGRMRKTFLQFTPVPDKPELWIAVGIAEDRPLYHLPKITGTGPVAIVEGEKCVEAGEQAWPDQIITTFAGGGNAWQLTDYEPLRGRKVALIADADTPGRTTMRQLAYYLDTEMDCVVRVGLPKGETKEDVADWLEQDDAASVLRRVKELLEDYDPDAADRIEPPAPPPPPLDGDIVSNDHYELLGLAGDMIAIRLITAGRVIQQSRESITQPGTLISLAPLEWWYGIADSDQLGASTCRRIGSALLRAADNLGQVDLTRRTGRGAVMLDDGTVVWHLGDRLLVDADERPLLSRYSPTGASALETRIWLAEPRIELGASASDGDMRKLAEAVMRYRWATPDDCRRFLGWMAAAVAGGALAWRPHLMLVAPSTAGKSWLMREVVRPIMGPLMIPIANASSASIARQTDVASLPILVDEAEVADPWVMDLFALLRVAAGGEGLRLRANSTGGVDAQEPRFAALLSGTSVPALQMADASRLTIVQLGNEVDDWPAVEQGILAAMEPFEAMRYRIIRRAPEIVALARAKTREYQSIGVASRDALIAGALTAGWHAWGRHEKEVHSRPIEEEQPELDALTCLRDILALQARTPDHQGDMSVLELLRGEQVYEQATADQFGVKVEEINETRWLAIGTKHRGLRTHLGRTRWGNADLRALLMQIPGAEARKQLRFNGLRMPAVVLKLESLAADHGIDIRKPLGQAPESQPALDPEPRR